jgi:DNA-binding MarR family transcriptional regulator
MTSTRSTAGSPPLATLVRRLHLVIRERVHADLVAAGHTDLTIAQIYVFQTSGPEGLRPTELAARTNTTKQAMNHQLNALERLGYLERVPSVTDRRATVIRLTDKGHDVARITQHRAQELEREWASAIGVARMGELRQLLADVTFVADPDSAG